MTYEEAERQLRNVDTETILDTLLIGYMSLDDSIKARIYKDLNPDERKRYELMMRKLATNSNVRFDPDKIKAYVKEYLQKGNR